MAGNYSTPGVYIEEVSKFPPSVAPVATAVPAFLGYTTNTQYQGEDLVNTPKRITSFLEFETLFGTAPEVPASTANLDADGNLSAPLTDPASTTIGAFRLSYALRHFYQNGGGDAYVISLGNGSGRTDANSATAHHDALAALALEDEPTLIVLPDLAWMTVDATGRALFHGVQVAALAQCADLGDRFLIGDILGGDQVGDAGIDALRNGIGTQNLKYGAIYHPQIQTTTGWNWNEATVTAAQPETRLDDGSISATPGPADGLTLAALREGPSANPEIYARIRAAMDALTVTLPPSPAIAGAYATVDRTRGVFKAPGNVSLAGVRSLTVAIDRAQNDRMNVHATGKSINAIRAFIGRGSLVWGARTLDGNSNEWRYVNVRRFFNFVEESTKKASFPFVFAPNNAATWARVKGMIENFLTNQWRLGALAGATPEDAFFVRVGLGTTMTAQDVLEGRMNVEIGMAVVRPAEFIILRFSHKLPSA